MINEIFVNAVPIIRESDIPPRNEIQIVTIRCTRCQKTKSLRVFRKSFLLSPYICISCGKRGNANPFYGRHHSIDSKRKIGGAVCNYNGENNPFYGSHHSYETISKLKSNPRCYHFSTANPFYGRHHSENTKSVIKRKNKEFRKNNPEKVIENELRRLGKTKEDFFVMLNDYVMNVHNKASISEKHGIDFRTMKSWWLFYNMISPTDLKRVTKYKQLFSNPSKPEMDVYHLLKQKYGEVNVNHCYELDGYYYDICLFGKVLVEYDGYYWHKIVKNKNDAIKEERAKIHGYILYRIEEPPIGKLDMQKEMQNINTLLVSEGVI